MKKQKTVNKLSAALNILLPVLFAFGVGSIFTLSLGKNPLEVYGYIVRTSLFSKSGIMNTLGFATPLMITGIAMAFSFSAGIWNMGIEGQLCIGGFFAAYLGYSITGLPPILHVGVCILGGMCIAMIFSLIPAFLKAYMRINEVVVTIMLNSIATIIANYFTNGPFSGHLFYASTPLIQETAELAKLNPRYRVTYGLFLALAVLLVMWIIMRKTKLGYEISCMGKQSEFSDAVGMKVYQKTIIVFLVGGLLAGLAGAGEVLGVNGSYMPGFSGAPGLGWDGMMICVLANNNPLGVLIVALLFGAFKYGSVSLQAGMGVPMDLIGIIQSSLILFMSARYVNDRTAFLAKTAAWLEALFHSKKQKV